MNKAIPRIAFETIGNTIMFVLLALFFTKGMVITEVDGRIIVSPTIYIYFFIVYMFVYVVILALWNRKQGAPWYHLLSGIQLHKDADEREKAVTYRATKAAYYVAMGSILLAVVLLAFINLKSASTGIYVDFYVAGVWLFALCCVAINLAFSLAWCIEYRK